MSIALTIAADDQVTPFLTKLRAAVEDRAGLNEFIAGRMEATTREYLLAIAQVRHASAEKLGAAPTGHLELAAQSVHSSSDADAATVGITSPGISRVAGPVEIEPVNGRFLTIPANAMAYGHRAEEVARQIGDLRFVVLGGRPALVHETGKGKEKQLDVFYWLVTHVTLPEDRTLLPSDETYLAAAEAGARDFFDFVTRN